MGLRLSKEASFDVQEEETNAYDVKILKQSIAGRLRSKIIRSPTSTALFGEEQLVGTPIAKEIPCGTPVEMILVDPMSPGMVESQELGFSSSRRGEKVWEGSHPSCLLPPSPC